MKPPHDDRALELFASVCDLDSRARREYLDRTCGNDPALRRRVESLLGHDANPLDILQTGAAAGSAAEPALPDRIGAYRILGLLGEGGMGRVYRAEQEKPVRRTVALKLIRFGTHDRRMVARFEVERQALASMNHPNIARVLEAGATEDGQPYFAMEFIDGESILDYCTGNRFSLRQRLLLFLQVCRGVQHAHRNAVIHRDIKPSNVIVSTEGGVPTPKIIDFGIAKLADGSEPRPTLATAHGDLIGTPEYMSPEQLSGGTIEIDTRTDVYSLGVLLYELITGNHPYATDSGAGLSLDELRERIRELVPQRPSTQARRAVRIDRPSSVPVSHRELKGDLDWITLKALEKEPDRRYESVAELARDLERHLEHRPVSARRPSYSYRLGRYALRHRVGVAACGLVLVLIGALTVAQIKANSAARMSGLVSGMLDARHPGVSTTQPSPNQVLERWVYVARTQFASNSLERANLLHNLAVFTVWWSGNRNAALELESEAAQIFEERLGPRAPSTLASKAYEATLIHDFRVDKVAMLKEILEAGREAGADLPVTAKTEVQLALEYRAIGDLPAAEELLRDATVKLEKLLGRDHPDTIEADSRLASVLSEQGRSREAEQLLDNVVTRFDRLGERHRYERSRAHYNLAWELLLRGEREVGLQHLKRAAAEGFNVHPDYGDDTTLRDDLAVASIMRQIQLNDPGTWLELLVDALVAKREGRIGDAEAAYRSVAEAVQRTNRFHEKSASFALENLGWILTEEKRCEEAIALFPALLRSIEESGTGAWRTADTHWDWAGCEWRRGNRTAAEQHMNLAEGIWATEPESPEWAYFEAGRHAFAGRRAEGLDALRRAIARGLDYLDFVRRDPLMEPLHGGEFDELTLGAGCSRRRLSRQ